MFEVITRMTPHVCRATLLGLGQGEPPLRQDAFLSMDHIGNVDLFELPIVLHLKSSVQIVLVYNSASNPRSLHLVSKEVRPDQVPPEWL